MADLNIADVRAKYPQYGDMSDDQLGQALHAKFYNDMPYEAFASKIGLKPAAPAPVAAPPESTEGNLGASFRAAGHDLGGAVDTIGTSLMNAPSAAINGVSDILQRITGNQNPKPVIKGHFSTPAADDFQRGLSNATAVTPTEMSGDPNEASGFGLHGVTRDITDAAVPVARDAAAIAPMAGAAKFGAGAVADALAPEATSAGLTLQRQGGIRTALGGGGAVDQATLQNARNVNQITGGEAGVQSFTPSTGTEALQMLEEGRKAPNDVYNRLANSVNTAPLSDQTTTRIANAGGNAMQVGSPDVQSQIAQLKSNLLSGPTDGQTMVNNGRSLRYDGFRNSGSQDPNLRLLGKTQLDMADAVEDHLAQNLPKNADVTMEQFVAARRALAKNATVTGAVAGSGIDPQAIARMNASSPGRMDGGLLHIADWAADNPAVARTAQSVMSEPSIAGDVADSHNSIAAAGKLVGGKLARNLFAGNEADNLAAGRTAFPPRNDAQFAPPSMATRATAYPALPPATATVGPVPQRFEGVGDTSAPVGLADELGLSPGTRAAAQQHPAVARPGVEEAPPRSMPEVDLHTPGNFSDVLATSRAQMTPPPARPTGIPLQDLLSHGVEQPPGQALSLADELATPAKSSDSIPFTQNADHMAGGLSLMDELATPARSANSDLPKVASQGVPEDIMARAPQKTRYKAGDIVSAPKGGFQKPKKVTDG